jgi:hypothetical protein
VDVAGANQIDVVLLQVRTPPWVSFVVRLEVPLAKSVFSHQRAEGKLRGDGLGLRVRPVVADFDQVCPAGVGSFVVEMKRIEKAFARKTK